MDTKQLQSLERRDRAIWVLYVKCDFTLEEIGKMFGIKRQSVWERLNKVNDEVTAGKAKFDDLS